MRVKVGFGDSTPYVLSAAALGAATFSSFSPHIEDSEMTKESEKVRNVGATPGTESIDERLLNAKLEAVEARTETKFAQLLGKIELVAGSINALDTKVSELGTELGNVKAGVSSAEGLIVTTVIASAIAIAGLAWAGVALFQGGMSTTADAYANGLSAGGLNDGQSQAGD